MFTKTISRDGFSIILGRTSNWTAFSRSIYRKALITLYPQFGDLLMQVESGKKESNEINEAVATLSPDDRTIYNILSTFLYVASHTLSANGFHIKWPTVGEMPSNDTVQEMVGIFLLDSQGIWTEASEGLHELLSSLASPEAQAIPPGEEVTTDPNSSAPTENGNSVLSTAVTTLQ